MKTLAKIVILLLLMTFISCSTEPTEEILLDSSAIEVESFEGNFEAKDFETLEKHNRYFAISREEAFNPILNEVSGKSTLIRGRRGIWARYKAEKLIPGHAYTLW